MRTLGDNGLISLMLLLGRTVTGLPVRADIPPCAQQRVCVGDESSTTNRWHYTTHTYTDKPHCFAQERDHDSHNGKATNCSFITEYNIQV